MIIRKFKLSDFEELVSMYYDFMVETNSNRVIGDKYFYYRAVQEWINEGKDIVVTEKKDTLTGFSLCYVDDMRGLTETMYQCDFAYVKPEFRNTRSAYLIYNNANEYAKDLGYKVSSNGRIENGVDKMMKKHFNLQAKYTMYEGV